MANGAKYNFDFVNRTTEIRKLAEWDRMISNPTFQTTSMGDFKQRKLTDKKIFMPRCLRLFNA